MGEPQQAVGPAHWLGGGPAHTAGHGGCAFQYRKHPRPPGTTQAPPSHSAQLPPHYSAAIGHLAQDMQTDKHADLPRWPTGKVSPGRPPTGGSTLKGSRTPQPPLHWAGLSQS